MVPRPLRVTASGVRSNASLQNCAGANSPTRTRSPTRPRPKDLFAFEAEAIEALQDEIATLIHDRHQQMVSEINHILMECARSKGMAPTPASRASSQVGSPTLFGGRSSPPGSPLKRGSPPGSPPLAEKADGMDASIANLGRSMSGDMAGAGVASASLASMVGDRRSQEDRSGEHRDKRSAKASWFSLEDEDNKRLRHAKSFDFSSEHAPPGGSAVGCSLQRLARGLITSSSFECFMALAIFSNSVLIGVEVEYNSRRRGESSPFWLYGVTHAYTFLFLVELLARVAVHRCEFFRSGDWSWNLFDALVVVSSLVDLATDVVGMLTSSAAEHMQNVSNVRILRVLRVTRLFRTVRIARIVRFVSALRLLVSAILSTLRSLVWAFVLMALIIYIFAIVFTQSAHATLSEQLAAGGDGRPATGCSDDALEKYWGSLGASMFTLYMSITGGLSWDAAVEPLGAISWHLNAIFLLFIFIVHFAVLNVVTGFFCQAASDAAYQDPEVIVHTMMQSKRKHETQIKNLFQRLDIHSNGELHYDELCEAMKNERVQAHFEGLEVDVSDTWTLFKLINLSRSGIVNIDEFIEGCMRLKGPARSTDIERIISDNMWFMQRVSKFIHHAEAHLEHISKNIVVI